MGSADPLHELIRRARERDPGAVSSVLERARLAAPTAWGDLVDAVVVPIPRHVPGNHHPLLMVLARDLAIARGWPSAPDALARERPTGQAKTAHARDVDDEAGTLRWHPPVHGAVIVLLDDVVRTGMTLEGAARAIRRAGDDRPLVAVALARAVPA